MENHPIPQDVTGFKFKLIGSVTIKQFLYLLGAGILTTLVFILPINVFIKIPLMAIFSLIGIGLAFVPIEGRPMDTMIVNFAKTIPNENRYIYKKRGVNLSSFEFFKPPIAQMKVTHVESEQEKPETDSKRAILIKQLQGNSFKPDAEEQKFFKNVKSIYSEEKISATPMRIQQMPDLMPNDTKTIEERIAPVELPVIKDEVVTPIIKYPVNTAPAPLQKETPSVQAAPDLPAENAKSHEGASVTTAQSQLKAGFPTLPDIPNIVLGIVKDPRDKVIPNILVEIVDTNNVPVRAFKTNALGQFASATPLANGQYKIIFEDPQKRNDFESIDLTIDGKICNPLEIISIDAREKLRRELFDNGSTATPQL